MNPAIMGLLKGMGLGGVLALVLVLTHLLGTPGEATGRMGGTVAVFGPILIFLGPGLIIGAGIIGLLGGILRENRRRHMILAVVGLYLFFSFSIASIMIFFDDSGQATKTVGDTLYNISALGITGAIIFGLFLIPLLLGATLLIERWTRPK